MPFLRWQPRRRNLHFPVVGPLSIPQSSCSTQVWKPPFSRAKAASKASSRSCCDMNKASDFSTPRRWVLSTSLLQMIKENNCILTTRIDILKWKRNEEQILGGLPLMIIDFPEWEPFQKSDPVFFFLYRCLQQAVVSQGTASRSEEFRGRSGEQLSKWKEQKWLYAHAPEHA